MRALLGLLFCATLAAQTASIEGTVVNHATGQPIEGAHLHFVTGDFGDGGGLNQFYGAVSDRTGHFSITGMKPGIFFVVPERAGFVPLPRAKPAPELNFLPLKSGQHLVDYKIEMTPRATISGRVLDEYGDPVENIPVELEPLPGSSRMENFFGGRQSSSDDLGSFRVITAPGRYYVHASVFQMGQGQETSNEVRTDGTSAQPFVSTYYPSAASTGAASVVEVAAGQDVAGIEIRLTRSTATGRAPSLTISGVVSGAPDNHMVNVTLRQGENFNQFFNTNTTIAGGDGKFAFRGLQPGAYRVSARYSSGKTVLRSQNVDLTLDSADATGLLLTLTAAEELTGTLAIDGNPAAGATHSVRLDPAENMGNPDGSDTTAASVDETGAFRIANVEPSRLRVVVEPMGDNDYIQSVTLDRTAAADNIVDLSHGVNGAHLKIAVSRNGAQVSGAVLDGEGQPIASPLVFIFLVDDPKKMKQMDSGANRASGGKYSIKGIRPGKYRLFAVDVLALAAAAGDNDRDDDDETSKAIFNSAEEIEIKAGDNIVKDVKAIDKLPGKEPPHAAQNQ